MRGEDLGSLSIFIQRGPWPLVNRQELCVSRSHYANILATSTYIFFTRFLLARATLKSDARTPLSEETGLHGVFQ